MTSNSLLRSQLEDSPIEIGYRILSQITVEDAIKLLTSSSFLSDKYRDYIDNVKELTNMFFAEEIPSDHPLFYIYEDYETKQDQYMVEYIENFIKNTDPRRVAIMIRKSMSTCPMGIEFSRGESFDETTKKCPFYLLQQNSISYSVKKYLKTLKINLWNN